MVIEQKVYTRAEFQRISALPENADKILELIGGEIVEKVPSFTPSKIAARISYYLMQYLMQHDIGYVTGEAGGYILSDDNTFNPDVGYISKVRLPEAPAREAPVPPDLAVEVMSPTDRKRDLRLKAETYLQYGTKAVWLVFPEEQRAEVYVPDEDVIVLELEAAFDGGDVLPGFTLPLRDVFPA